MGLARMPAKLDVRSEALTLVTVPPDTSAMAPRFSRSQASLSTETTSIVTPFPDDCHVKVTPPVVLVTSFSEGRREVRLILKRLKCVQRDQTP